MIVCCECCVLSGRGLCFRLITCPEESYLVCCVSEYNREASKMWRPCPNTKGCSTMLQKCLINLLTAGGGASTFN